MNMPKKEIKTFKKGEVIFRQGTASLCMYDIRWGSVGIFADYRAKTERKLATLEAGEFFGEMGMIEGYLRSASAVALENDTQIEIIDPESFESYFKDKPAKVLMIMQHMSQRIRVLTKDYLDACRAVAEVEESEKTGAEKSGWFKENLKKFVDDYQAGVQAMAESDLMEHPPVGRHW